MIVYCTYMHARESLHYIYTKQHGKLDFTVYKTEKNAPCQTKVPGSHHFHISKRKNLSQVKSFLIKSHPWEQSEPNSIAPGLVLYLESCSRSLFSLLCFFLLKDYHMNLNIAYNILCSFIRCFSIISLASNCLDKILPQ